MDWPSSHFWWELAAAYPEAKVVLTVRDPRRWFHSLRTTVFDLGVHAAVWANVTVRILVTGLFAYHGTRETYRSRAAKP